MVSGLNVKQKGNCYMETITRRVFLKRTVSGIGGIMLARAVGPGIGMAQQPPADVSRVVVVEHPEATDGVRIINPVNVQTMVDESVKQLTGQASVADAWASLLPDFKENHIVAIKVNTINASLPTHPVVVDAITSGLIAAGVLENNISSYMMHCEPNHGSNGLLTPGINTTQAM